MPSSELPPLFDRVDATVNTLLRVRSYRHRATVNAMRNQPPGATVGIQLARCVYEEIALVFPQIAENPRRRLSKENWRCYSPSWTCKDRTGEVGLERAIVRACKERGRSDWWNQVPVASGLVNGSAGKRRAIDLVRRGKGGSVDFVELKIDSDSVLYATVEILQYGFAWLLSRQFKDRLRYDAGTLLDASDVRLNVLAWPRYFRGVDFSKFEAGLSKEIREIGARHSVSMDFRFVRFPVEFVWPGDYTNEALCSCFDNLFS